VLRGNDAGQRDVLAALPKSAHSGAKNALAQMWNGEDKRHSKGGTTPRQRGPAWPPSAHRPHPLDNGPTNLVWGIFLNEMDSCQPTTRPALLSRV
jgi:hypothetical protein